MLKCRCINIRKVVFPVKKQVRSLGIVIPILLLCALLTGCAGDAVSYVGGSAQTSAKLPQSTTDAVVMVPEVTTSTADREPPAPVPVTTSPETVTTPPSTATETTAPVSTRPLPDFPLEEKIYFDADLLNDETLIWDSPCQIFVTLQTRYSVKLHEYTVDDFPEIKCTEVSNSNLSLWEDELRNTMNQIQYGIGEPLSNNAVFRLKKFHQYLTITLETSDLNEMLEAIRLLEQREDVLYAHGSYYEPVILH